MLFDVDLYRLPTMVKWAKKGKDTRNERIETDLCEVRQRKIYIRQDEEEIETL